MSDSHLQLDKEQNPILELSEKQSKLKLELDNTNTKIDALGKRSMHTSNFKTKLEERSKKVCKVKNDIQVVTFGLEEKLSSKSDRATQNNNKISTLNTDINNDENQLSDIKRVTKIRES